MLRGVGNQWDDGPGLDFVGIENTLGKFGERVEDFNGARVTCSRWWGQVDK